MKHTDLTISPNISFPICLNNAGAAIVIIDTKAATKNAKTSFKKYKIIENVVKASKRKTKTENKKSRILL